LLPRFRKEFETLYGGRPFPWQERLFLQFCAGEIPSALDLPTGLGKTSVMALWLLARALAPETIRKDIPRRLVYVVDRRVVVDQATTEAEKLRCWLEGSGADLKPALNLAHGKLPISTLRGQLADNREWREYPAACAIVVGTVDMIGSRILFSGYGVSPKMRPYHAGLLGADALVVLDEAHLVPPFEALLRTIELDCHQEFGPKILEPQIVPRLRLMSLSATGARNLNRERVFALNDEDYQNEVVRQRLRAAKHLTIDDGPASETLAERLAARAWTLATDPRPARVLVYCDRREDALKVRDEIQRRAGKGLKDRIDLLVGERRVNERQLLLGWLRQHEFVEGPSSPPDASAFLVATSAGEVGVDLDADHMVCDLVEWERMVQRLGRVNRRGLKQSRIEVIPAGPKDKKKDAAEWGERIARLRAPLDQLSITVEGSYDASPDQITAVRNDARLKDELRKAESPKLLYPTLTRALVEAWTMTSLEQHTGRPDVEPWLRGWKEDEEPKSTIAWRRFLPIKADEKPSTKDKYVDDFFEAAPIQITEMLETETRRAVDWVIARAMATASDLRRGQRDQHGNLSPKDTVALFVLDHKGRFEGAYTVAQLAELERKEKRKDYESFGKAIAGRALIVSSLLGGLDSKGVLDHEAGEEPPTIDGEDTWTAPAPFRVRTTESATADDKDWREFYRLAIERSADDTELRWIVVEQERAQGQTDESLAVARKEQLLEDHHQKAAAAARELAQSLRLPAPYHEMLALVAKVHDEGKNTNLWQRAFKAPPGKKIYAKTKGPVNRRLLDGYRHEFGSLLCAKQNAEVDALRPDLRDLALHLIASHHGRARPLISARSCEAGPPSMLQDHARKAALRFARLQKQWGPWGLAWWEALLRSVDQQVSRDNDASEAYAIDNVKIEETV
jgi:CRISPR-associated endonuclease/helicase Cas3